MSATVISASGLRRGLAFLTLLGLFLTVRGYRSREGDQAYRLPILLRQQAPNLYAADPFVRAFDRFNPHRGVYALMDAASRPAGLSVALAVLFGLTFLTTCFGIDKLARVVWGDDARGVGLVAASLVLIAQAGNVGTNHLFEPILLDRLIAFAFGWTAVAFAVENGPRGRWLVAPLVAASVLVHPSVGLQLAMLMGATAVAWTLGGKALGFDRRGAAWMLLGVAIAVLPGGLINLGQTSGLTYGLSPDQYRRIAAELQVPQHMLPHLWRWPQWLAWFCYPALALIASRSGPTDTASKPTTAARRRLLVLIGVNLAGLLVAWYGIERVGHLRLTLFQPFRMATIARGLCLVLLAGHLRRLWVRGTAFDRLRASIVVVGLISDWWLVVATSFEVVMIAGEGAADRLFATGSLWGVLTRFLPGAAVLAAGIVYLSRHDTDSGHVPMLAVVAASLAFGRIAGAGFRPATPGRMAFRFAAAWVVPAAAVLANLVPEEPLCTSCRAVRGSLVRRCRFAEVPLDDVERLALWCRENTPEDATFVGPPGVKTFRLWSLRNVAFNRASSPYHASGLADWFRRYRDHVGFSGSDSAFIAAYLRDRHALEQGYDRKPPSQKAALADRQGAGYVVARVDASDDDQGTAGGPLERLHVEGRYAVYRVNGPRLVAARRAAVE